MTEEDLHHRALQIERQLRRFLVVTNSGSIDGGFAVLDTLKPPSEDLFERIGNIKTSMSGFELIGGDGLSASGTLNDGYMIQQSG